MLWGETKIGIAFAGPRNATRNGLKENEAHRRYAKAYESTYMTEQLAKLVMCVSTQAMGSDPAGPAIFTGCVDTKFVVLLQHLKCNSHPIVFVFWKGLELQARKLGKLWLKIQWVILKPFEVRRGGFQATVDNLL